jgi:hypothetical protein
MVFDEVPSDEDKTAEMPPLYKREAVGSMKGMPGRIVSKKELADSGMNLRDFLNKERGLSRRPEVKPPAPVAPAAVSKIASVDPRDAEAGNTRGTNPDTMMMGKGRRAVTGELVGLDSRAVRDRKSAQIMMDQDEKLRVKKAADRFGQKLAPSYPKDTDEETILNKRGGKIKAYAKGGSVSNRADGIAQRGKTRGMMR